MENSKSEFSKGKKPRTNKVVDNTSIPSVPIEGTTFRQKKKSGKNIQKFEKSQSEGQNQDAPDELPKANKNASLYYKINNKLRRWRELPKDHPWIAGLIFLLTVLIPVGFTYIHDIYPIMKPVPKMRSEFNVAVARFDVIDQLGKSIKSDDGLAVADFLYQRLDTSFEEMDLKNIKYEIRKPEITGVVRGKTTVDREKEAETLTAKIGADVLIYGVIKDGQQPELIPEFYINYQGWDQADEITGQHAMGTPLRIELPFDKTKFQDISNPALSGRASALSLIAIGLAYYSVDNPNQALNYFNNAEAIKSWFDNAGKEVIYLLIGNGYSRISSMNKSVDNLPDAYEAYSNALKINPSYARAKLGQAGILYLMALGDPENPSLGTVDLRKLDESENAFHEASRFADQPTKANINIKVNFGLGQIYIARGEVQDTKWLDRAENEFQQVISDYENGNKRIIELASQAYARRGLISLIKNNVDHAIEYYKLSIKIASPHFKAYYYTRLGEIYASQGKYDLAVSAYDEAFSTAEYYSDPDFVNKYQKRKTELEALK